MDALLVRHRDGTGLESLPSQFWVEFEPLRLENGEIRLTHLFAIFGRIVQMLWSVLFAVDEERWVGHWPFEDERMLNSHRSGASNGGVVLMRKCSATEPRFRLSFPVACIHVFGSAREAIHKRNASTQLFVPDLDREDHRRH